MIIPRNAIQDFLYWFDPTAPTEDQTLQALISMAKQINDIKNILQDLTTAMGATVSSTTSSSQITQPDQMNVSAFVSINFPSWLYPTANSVGFYERKAENVIGVISDVLVSSLVTEVDVPSGYVGFLYRIATDDNISTFHQYIIDGVLDNQYSGTASPQGTEPMLTLFPPLQFKKRLQYWATNYNTSTLTYQGIFVGWFTPNSEV